MEDKLKQYIMDNIFSYRPNLDNDWELFMENEELELPFWYTLCQEYELENSRSIKGLMQSQYTSLSSLIESLLPKKLYVIKQYDIWFSNSSKVVFGVLDTYEKALNEMKQGFEKLYPDFNSTLTANGTNQWISDKYNFGVMISELPSNVFGEI